MFLNCMTNLQIGCNCEPVASDSVCKTCFLLFIMSYGDNITTETAFHMIARGQKRPPLNGIENNLFPFGPQPGEVVEFHGEASVGKTLLLLECIKKCILPSQYDELSIGGLEAGVIFLNSDIHFNIAALVTLLRNHLKYCIPDMVSKSEIINKIVITSLSRLTIFNIYDSEALYTTFRVVERLLCTNINISLLVLDSISSFYWQDRLGDGVKKMDTYISHVLNTLHRYIHPFQITLFFTRPSYFQTKNIIPRSLSLEFQLHKVNTSIELMKRPAEQSSTNVARVRTASTIFIKCYSIKSLGFAWSL